MANVFISYAREDRDFAEVVQAKLERAGHTTVLDFDILSAGDDWQDELDGAIRRAQALIVIMTPPARESDYVAYEWAFALGAGVKVIPIELKQTTFSPRLGTLHRLDFTNSARPWDTLLAEVKKAELSQPLTSIDVDPAAPVAVKQAARAIDSLDPAERLAAVQTLAQIQHPAAKQALAHALQHPVTDVQIAAACLFPDATDVRIVQGLVTAYRQDRFTWLDDAPFVSRIEAIGAPAVPHLLEALGSATDDTRVVIIDALGHISDATILPTLSAELLHDDPQVREAAAQALGRIGDPTAADALTTALDDSAENVRRAAAVSLGMLRATTALPRLIAMLDEDTRHVRSRVATALGQIGDWSAVQPLTTALADDDIDVVLAAAAALGELGYNVVAPHLRQLIQHRQSDAPITALDSAVMLALAKLQDAESLPLIEARLLGSRGGHYSQIEQLCRLIADADDEGVARVIRIAQTAYSSTARDMAARALASIDTPEAKAAYQAWHRRR